MNTPGLMAMRWTRPSRSVAHVRGGRRFALASATLDATSALFVTSIPPRRVERLQLKAEEAGIANVPTADFRSLRGRAQSDREPMASRDVEDRLRRGAGLQCADHRARPWRDRSLERVRIG